MAGERRRLSAILAADVVGYSRLVGLDEAGTMGCRACGTPGGGCQFLGTAATSQVVAEALGLALPHSALAPSGEPVWLALAGQAARSLVRLASRGVRLHRYRCTIS